MELARLVAVQGAFTFLACTYQAIVFATSSGLRVDAGTRVAPVLIAAFQTCNLGGLIVCDRI